MDLMIIAGAVLVLLIIWRLFPSKAGKASSKAFSEVIQVKSQQWVEMSKADGLINKIEFMEDLADRGLSKEAVAESIASFDDLIK